jgi:20S proteasome subunit beta 5
MRLLRLVRAAIVSSSAAAAASSSSLSSWELGPSLSIEAKGAPPLLPYHGTTTVALQAKDCIVVAVDSRASMGSHVGSQTTLKVIPVSNKILGTMAGGAADCTFWLRRLRAHVKLLEAEQGGSISVQSAARLLASTLHGLKGSGLSVGTMIMGCDSRQGPLIFYVDSEGSQLPGPYFAVGSGSTYAYGVLDGGYEADMAEDKAIELAEQAIRRSVYRDAYSGGFVNIFVVDKEKWRLHAHKDLGGEGLSIEKA